MIVVGILINIVASVGMAAFTRILIDNYILPMVASGLPFGKGEIYASFLTAILTIGGIYLAGILAVTLYSQLTVFISHRVFKSLCGAS